MTEMFDHKTAVELGALLPTHWLTKLSDGNEALCKACFDKEYGLKVEVSGIYADYDDKEPSANLVTVWLYRHNMDEQPSHKFYKEFPSVKDAVNLACNVSSQYENGSLEELDTYCIEQEMTSVYRETREPYSWMYAKN